MMATGIANADVVCSSIEFLNFNPPPGQTCDEYLGPYISMAGGYLSNGNATSDCSFCTLSDTNAFLAQVNSFYSERWRNFGLMWPFIIFNIAGAIFFYWLARVPKKVKTEKVKEE
jgi:ATP-binding cassette, subfamily G (WHITE), member 2, PDR